MSARKSKPTSSRRYRAASSSRAGSTTIVVSPYPCSTSTRPGTRLKVIGPPERSDGSTPHPRKMRSIFRASSACDLAHFVRGRNAGEHALVQPDDAFHQRLWAWWTARDIDVDGDDLVDALKRRVVVEHPGRA